MERDKERQEIDEISKERRIAFHSMRRIEAMLHWINQIAESLNSFPNSH